MNVTSISKCHPARRAQKSKQSWHKLRQREIISASLAPCSEAQDGDAGHRTSAHITPCQGSRRAAVRQRAGGLQRGWADPAPGGFDDGHRGSTAVPTQGGPIYLGPA